MNYRKIYDSIIDRARVRLEIVGYYESHHILPTCCGGCDSEDNLVKLTAREHFLCHWLLYKIYKTPKLAYAWNCMCMNFNGERNYNSISFSLARKAAAEARKGFKHTEEAKKKISEAGKGRVKSEETLRKLSESGKIAQKGRVLSEEHRLKISNTLKGRKIPPEVVEKTASKNRGKARSQETKDLIAKANSGVNSYNFKGYYIVEGSRYITVKDAIEGSGGKYTHSQIYKRCRENNNSIVTRSKKYEIPECDVGKTWKDLGWGYEVLTAEQMKQLEQEIRNLKL